MGKYSDEFNQEKGDKRPGKNLPAATRKEQTRGLGFLPPASGVYLLTPVSSRFLVISMICLSRVNVKWVQIMKKTHDAAS